MLKCTIILSSICICLLSCQTNDKTSNLIDDEWNSYQLDSIMQGVIVKADVFSIDSSDHQAALKLMLATLEGPLKEHFPDSLLALGYQNVGGYYYREKQTEKGIAHLDTSILLLGIPTKRSGKKVLATSYFFRSISNENHYVYSEALKDIQVANELIKDIPDYDQVKGKYFSKTGLYYQVLGEKSKALEYLEQADLLLEKQSIERAELFEYYGNLYRAEDEIVKAINYYDKSIGIYQNNKVKRELGFAVEVNRLAAQVNGKGYSDMKRMTLDFLASFEANTNYFLQEKSTLVKNLAFYAWRANEFADSKKYYLEALNLVNQLTSSIHTRKHGLAYEGLGDVEFSLGEFESSIALYHKAIQALSIGFDSKDIYSLPNLEEHVIIYEPDLERIIGFKADAIEAKYQKSKKTTDLNALLNTYLGLDKLWTQMRQGYRAAMSRYDLVEKNLPKYEKATSVALELYRITSDNSYLETAYLLASKNKAIVMLDGLQDEEAKFGQVDTEIIKRETKLKQKIYSLDSRIFELSKNKNLQQELEKAENERFNISMEYEQLISQMEKEYPNYYQLKYSDKKPISLIQRQELLPENAAVVEYFVGRDSIYAFSYSKHIPLRVLVVEKNEEFNTQLNTYRGMTEEANQYSIQEFAELSNSVYNLLLKEVVTGLDESIDRLFIIPDDKLMQISFDVLFTKSYDAQGQEDWTSPHPYLLRKYALSYAYSNQLLFDQVSNDKLKRSNKNYLGFGLEYDDFTLQGIEQLQPIEVDTVASRGMGKLVYSVDEIKESASILGGKFYLNNKATKQRFLDQATKAKIIHLAMHGFVIKDKPMNSGLIFTRNNEEDDFVLKAGDLYTTKLNADLAVLSACHTGDGKLQKGEGVRSIARAFSYAGCPNITASLWAAPDLSTKQIVVEFYKNLKENQSIDVALQNAKLHYLDHCKFNKEALPYHWSHLITIGNTNPIFN